MFEEQSAKLTNSVKLCAEKETENEILRQKISSLNKLQVKKKNEKANFFVLLKFF